MYLTSKTFADLQEALRFDLAAFLPETILCGTIVLLLLLRMFKFFEREQMGMISLLLTLLALAVSVIQWLGTERFGIASPDGGKEIFTGLLVYDNFTVFVRLFLLGFTALLIGLSLLTGIPNREDSTDFHCLLLGSVIGMCLMASANHLLMVYIGVEMASLPSYALAGFLKEKRQSSEASLKYVVYGGGASGIMLYGISLLAGKFGTAYLPDLARGLSAMLVAAPEGTAGGFDPILLLGIFFVLIGLGFKLAAVPFHFWCPDVFEGATAEVAAFLSVASKGAALALLGRFAFTIVGLSGGQIQPDPVFWHKTAQVLGVGIAFFAAVTATYGNLAAYPQTNLKRLLAYSTIAHAGYMMMGLAPLSREGAAAVLVYLIAYLFMNLGAFAVVAFLRDLTGSEDLSSYRGLAYRSPLMAVLMTIFLLSLLGVPPLAGFVAKFQIFSVLFHAGQDYSAADMTGLGYTMYALLVIGGLNTAISAVYYINVLKVMILDQPTEEVPGKEIEPLPVTPASAFYGTVLATLIFLIGIAFNPLLKAGDKGVNRFRPAPPFTTAMAWKEKT